MSKKRSKKFKITYFSVEEEVINIFSSELKNCSSKTHSIGEDADAFFRVLSLDNKKSQYIHSFCLNKYRIENLPKVGDPASDKERKLPIQNNEGLVEKAYFAFNEKTGEIAFQNNGSDCCHRAVFPGIIKGLLKNTALEIMPVESKRYLLDDDEIVSLDIAFSYPDPSEEEAERLAKPQELDKRIAFIGEYFAVSKSQKIKLQVTQGRNAKFRKISLLGKKIKELLVGNKIDKGKVKIREKDVDGIDVGLLLINLAGSPKTKEIEVQLGGHYPVEEEVIRKLKACLSDE